MLKVIVIGFVCLISGCLSPQIDTNMILMQSISQKMDNMSQKLDRIDKIDERVSQLDQKILLMESNANVQVKSPIIQPIAPIPETAPARKGFFRKGLNSDQEDFVKYVLEYLK